MRDIILNDTVNNTALPLSILVDARIKALSSYKAWLQADPIRATMEGTSFASFSAIGTGAAFTSQRASPFYAAKQDNAIAGYPAAKFFNAGEYNKYRMSSAVIDWGQSWTMAFVYNASSEDASVDNTLTGHGGGATRVFLGQKASLETLGFNYGSSASISLPSARGAWHLAIVAFGLDAGTPANSKIKGMIDGARVADVVAPPIVSTAAADIGAYGTTQPFHGLISDAIFLQEDAFANADSLDALTSFAYAVYGVGA